MADLDLTEEQVDALRRQLETGDASTIALDDALRAILRHFPEPAVLEDGIYRDKAGAPREIVDGKIRGIVARGAFYDQDHEDTSGWTRVRVLEDGEVAVRRFRLRSFLDHAEKGKCVGCVRTLKRLLGDDDG